MYRLLLFAGLLCASTPALAGEPAHYDPDKVVAASSLFGGALARSAESFGPVDRTISSVNRSLGELDLNIALTVGAVDAAQHQLWDARLDERATTFSNEADVVQAQIAREEAVYIDGSAAALERAREALTAKGFDPIVECASKAQGLAGIQGPGGSSSSADCEGTDVSDQLAKLMDEDAELASAFAAVAAEGWPSVTSYSEAQPPLGLGGATGGATWVLPGDLAESIPEAIEYLDAIDNESARARAELIDAKNALDREDPDLEAKIGAIRDRAIQLREWGEARKAELGGRLWGGLERARKKGKKDGWADVGVCMNPDAWGGCDGRDVTDPVADVMVDDRKLRKELVDLLEAMDSPDMSL